MTQYTLKMASSVMAEGGSQEGSQGEEIEVVDIDEAYSEVDCISDQNEASDCVEIKDDEEEEPEVHRVINVIEELNTTSTSVGSSVTEITPSKLRRSTRTSARRYRRSNKTSTSSESEPEIVFIKKTQKRKKPRLINRKCIDENDNCKKETEDDTKDEKTDEKENKNYDSGTETSNSNKDKNSDIKLCNGHDRHRSSSPKVSDKKSEADLIAEGITTVKDFFEDSMCRKIEKKIDQICEKAKCGLYKQKTYDRAPLRNKYFFGAGYTYGKQMTVKGPGQERVYPKGEVDEIPKWIEKHIIQKMCDIKLVKEGFINSAVINEYFAGGCIVSHVDPMHIFDRPIISISFHSKSHLSFGVKFSFNPIRTTEPVYQVPLERGTLISISGYSADNVTHCIRPQDVCERRCVIILRRVFPDAPRVGDPMSPDHPLSLVRRHPNHPRSHSYESGPMRGNRRRPRRDRDRDRERDDHRESGESSSKKRKTRHSY